MMRTREEFGNLILEEINGLISEADRTILMEAIATRPEIAAYRDHLHQRFNASAFAATNERLDKEMGFSQLRAKLPSQLRVVPLGRRLAIAASVLILLGTGSFYWLQHQHKAATIVAATDLKAGEVRLQLANGQQIALSQDQHLAAGGLQLNTQGKTMHYQAAAEKIQWSTLLVPPGKDYTIVLPDGSTVQLNAASTIRFPSAFTGKREVYIDGEAYLQVAKNTAPFLVHYGHSTAEVLGTEFNVNTYTTSADKLALVQGSVRVTAGAATQLVSPGTKAVANGNTIHVSGFDADEVLAWRKGIYVFHGATLADMRTVFARLYGLEVVMDDEAVNRNRYNGFLDRNQPITAFLNYLKFSGAAEYHFGKDSVLHLQSIQP